MALSRLLLAAASSKMYIVGNRKIDKLIVQANKDEIILCFQLDDQERRVSHLLGLGENDKRCDGIIFYAKDGADKKTICLAEMKSTNIGQVTQQIKSTKIHIENLLRQDCGSHYDKLLNCIEWKACFYSYGTSNSDRNQQLKALREEGFRDVTYFDRSNNDIGPFLRGAVSAKAISDKIRRKQ